MVALTTSTESKPALKWHDFSFIFKRIFLQSCILYKQNPYPLIPYHFSRTDWENNDFLFEMGLGFAHAVVRH